MAAASRFTSPLPRFRVYVEILYNPKVQLLPEAMRWRFIALRCCAGTRTTPASNNAAVAYALNLRPKVAAETKRVLIDAGLIDEEWFPVAWEPGNLAAITAPPNVSVGIESMSGRSVTVRSQLRHVTVAP
jgi:hypothetical protein